MLYVSTRNTTDTYTAYRALHEAQAPDGGVYVPFHLPVFHEDELSALRSQSCGETVTQLLNLFFGLHLSVLDVEFAMGRNPFHIEVMQHRIVMAECWRNPEASFSYLLKSLYGLMTEQKSMGKLPVGWACIGIEIALLFGIYTLLDDEMRTFDIAVTACDFADLAAVGYAKKMGLPVNLTVCTCSENSALWDLLNRGAFSTSCINRSADKPDYLECYLYSVLGADATALYLEAVERNKNYVINEEQQECLNRDIFAAVVSSDRVDVVASNVYRSNGYSLDPDAALAYGGLQDYRAATGVSLQTLILAKKRPFK